jgi:hypothetical protein
MLGGEGEIRTRLVSQCECVTWGNREKRLPLPVPRLSHLYRDFFSACSDPALFDSSAHTAKLPRQSVCTNSLSLSACMVNKRLIHKNLHTMPTAKTLPEIGRHGEGTLTLVYPYPSFLISRPGWAPGTRHRPSHAPLALSCPTWQIPNIWRFSVKV